MSPRGELLLSRGPGEQPQPRSYGDEYQSDPSTSVLTHAWRYAPCLLGTEQQQQSERPLFEHDLTSSGGRYLADDEPVSLHTHRWWRLDGRVQCGDFLRDLGYQTIGLVLCDIVRHYLVF